MPVSRREALAAMLTAVAGRDLRFAETPSTQRSPRAPFFVRTPFKQLYLRPRDEPGGSSGSSDLLVATPASLVFSTRMSENAVFERADRPAGRDGQTLLESTGSWQDRVMTSAEPNLLFWGSQSFAWDDDQSLIVGAMLSAHTNSREALFGFMAEAAGEPLGVWTLGEPVTLRHFKGPPLAETLPSLGVPSTWRGSIPLMLRPPLAIRVSRMTGYPSKAVVEIDFTPRYIEGGATVEQLRPGEGAWGLGALKRAPSLGRIRWETVNQDHTDLRGVTGAIMLAQYALDTRAAFTVWIREEAPVGLFTNHEALRLEFLRT